jgi:hypothetical protein
VASVKWGREDHLVKETVVLEFVTINAEYCKQYDDGTSVGGPVNFIWNFSDNTPTTDE